MLSTLVDEAPTEKEWLYEVKWDGYRALSFCNEDKVNIISRNNKSFNDKFYPLLPALKKLKLNAVLDGEIVVLKDTGVTSFGALQNWRSEADGELIYYVFDILWMDGYDLMPLSLKKRKELLTSLLPKESIIRESENFDISAKKFLEAAGKMGLEGMMAKRVDSIYVPGERSRDWLKIKVQKRHEVVIGGYTKNDKSPKLFSALLVGVYENGALQFIGKIGTGFNDKQQKEMMAKFKPLIISKSPFLVTPDVNQPSRFRPNPPHAEAIWLSPKLVCEVSYTEMTEDGVMRHPSFEGMREDKNARNVHPEVEEKAPNAPPKKLNIKISPVKNRERKTLLNPSEETQVKNVKGHELKFNHLSKIFWPEEGYTKRDLLNYYYQVAPYILPYLKNRPQSLNRFPNGIHGLSFYQKDVTKSAPDWIKQFPYHTSDDKDKNFLIVQDEADLLWMANLGAIEMNPWNSTIEKPDYPDWCSIDIDPTESNTFDQVIQTALLTKQILDTLKIEGYCKTSGSTGLHIYIPMGAKYTYDQCQLFARMIATQVHNAAPKFTSIERYTEKRKGKIYVDFLQNRPKATLAAPYSVRPKPGAPVSMPLHWDEVKKGLRPINFTLKNAIDRIKVEGDLFKPVLCKGINLEKTLKILEKL
jgi:bifunctional non-homologous end joining protein LigD